MMDRRALLAGMVGAVGVSVVGVQEQEWLFGTPVKCVEQEPRLLDIHHGQAYTSRILIAWDGFGWKNLGPYHIGNDPGYLHVWEPGSRPGLSKARIATREEIEPLCKPMHLVDCTDDPWLQTLKEVAELCSE